MESWETSWVTTFPPPLKQKSEFKPQSYDLLTFTAKTFSGLFRELCLTILSFTVRNVTIPRIMKTQGICRVISYPNDNEIISIQGSKFFHFSVLPYKTPHPFLQTCQNLIPSVWAAPRKKMEATISFCKSWLGRKHYPFEHSMQHAILSGAGRKMSWRHFLCSVQLQGALRQLKSNHWQTAFFQRGLPVCLPFDPMLLYTQIFLHFQPTDPDIEGPVSTSSGGGGMKDCSWILSHCCNCVWNSMHKVETTMKVLLKLPLAPASSCLTRNLSSY